MVSIEHKQQVIAELQRCIDLATKKYNRVFAMPRVSYDLRGRTAGTANSRDYEIKLNPVLLHENPTEMIKGTTPHEFAHLVDAIVYPDTRRTSITFTRTGHPRRTKRSIHGPTWVSVMRLFGADPSRTHCMDTSNACVKATVRYDYRCDCGQVCTIGPKIHKRIVLGTKGYKYKACGHKITPSHAVAKNINRPKMPPITVQKAPKVPEPRVGGKLDYVLQMVGTTTCRDAQRLIRDIMRDVSMTKAGATTYYYKALAILKKEAASRNPSVPGMSDSDRMQRVNELAR